MDERVVQFIAGLRAAGVRISLAESQDAFRAVEQMGVTNRAAFRSALRATLIKERDDEAIFNRLFSMYFSSGGPPLIPAEQALTPDQQKMLEAAMRALAGDLSRLLQMLASGRGPTREEMERWARQAGANRARRPEQQQWITREMLRRMGLQQLAEQIEKLMQQLAAMGMTPEGQEAILRLIAANRDLLAEQTAQFVGQNIARQMSDYNPQKMDETELMQTPFKDLTEAEARELRKLVTRLAARLRSRAALRQKKGDGKTLDAKATLRANIQTGGVPFDLHFKKRHLKPKFALICDMSESMRDVIEFMLRLMYELQDQVAKARSFGFYNHLEDVTEEFIGHRPDEAIPLVKHRFPYIPYGTDLGQCLVDFCGDYLDAVDRRTTVIFLGDARNNFNSPRLDLFEHLKRRARRVVWFNPEPRYQWGTGDSDMHQYTPLCDAVHQVSNLAELTEAVDKLFTTR
ncbi:MAG TPA: VWA domain-containing protein [Anaerolineales bacterium]|nr:VWA domain-containing protein [Anaerolineales bacterium]